VAPLLDDYGIYMPYREAVNVDEMRAGRYLPEDLVEGCKLTSDVQKHASSLMTMLFFSRIT
jgi:predicted homoserine dehydrogenase-like protein